MILSDTVGFISDLPPQLVAAFRATLEEVLAADVIVHVRDIAHADTKAQKDDVDRVLDALGVDGDVKRLELWNKADLLTHDDAARLHTQAKRTRDTLLISALDGTGLDDLTAALSPLLTDHKQRADIDIDFSDGRARAWLYAHAQVIEETATEGGLTLQVDWTARDAAAFRAAFQAGPAA